MSGELSGGGKSGGDLTTQGRGIRGGGGHGEGAKVEKEKRGKGNKLASSKLRKKVAIRNYDSLNYSLTWVKCRATSVAKNG